MAGFGQYCRPHALYGYAYVNALHSVTLRAKKEKHSPLILVVILVLLISFGCTMTSVQVSTDSYTRSYSQVNDLSRQVDMYLSVGKIKQAKEQLDKALLLVKKVPNELQLAKLYGQLSDAHLLHQQRQAALQYAQKALTSAKSADSTEMQAVSLNYLGNSLFALKDYASAKKAYMDALVKLGSKGEQALQVSLLINLSYLTLAEGQLKQAETSVFEAITEMQEMPASTQKVDSLISTGVIILQLINSEAGRKEDLSKKALDVFNTALTISRSLNYTTGLSYANGHLGELYLYTKQDKIAEQLLSRAQFFATQNARPELTARWQWQLARLRQQQGRMLQAQIFYAQALEQLDSIRSSLLYGRRGWEVNEMAQQVYTDSISLLLQQVNAATGESQRWQLLYKVRELVENANSNELSHYLQDECVEAQRKKNAEIPLNERIQAGTAVLYTLIFPDHLVLLLNLADGDIRQFSIPVSNDELVKTASLFRRELSYYGNPRKIRQYGQQLYRWLIQPLREVLDKHEINTLVIAPAGILRTIPFAALYDGQHFLVNDFALAVTPGLKLTSIANSSLAEQRVLLNGLSEAVEGFSPLPFVEEEMNQIEPIYESTLLMNKDFRYQNIADLLHSNTYSAIVFATHSQFNQDAHQSYLLSYDGKINLNKLSELIRLNRFHEPPIDLLVLSACATAIGDERAALGMAGAALKAGAGSVVASLWLANDASTATLIPTFFAQLKQSQMTKAKALQKAQIALLKTELYQHPFHWAGFLLIGNWL